ncbi:citryl-CoA lyase [Actinomycetospora sp. NBRC 106375]|uniref:citryl-CoA lyase n=1 Tax=Actinomycetospora sp. NBRC 106375 TaxID=3032207 RepID=UPI0024A5632E|nr:citryl-CoA lyase [Actinomycetospora sp. NBRC 106375]GLZ48841.1 citryl-CoA lyase [Actinomycetospora sp. NBRC 106375]
MTDPAPILDVRSDICWSDETSVTVLGRDLCTDLIGSVDLGTFAYLLLTERMPSEAEAALFNAALVSLVEHGLTPNVLATRMTFLGAPESLQGAVAAGLLGLGTRFVGTIEGSARYLAESLATLGADPSDDDVRDEARRVVDGFRAQRAHVPGVGHPVHTPVDPRAEALLDLADRLGFPTTAGRLLRAVAAAASESSGRHLPVNVTGAIGACVVLLGVDWRIARGMGVIARTIGLVGHLREELAEPIATTIWNVADESASRHLRP